MFIKKQATKAYEFEKKKYNDGFSELEKANVLKKHKGGDHWIISVTDNFKNEHLNLKVLDKMPDDRPRDISDGVIISGRPFTLFATIDEKKAVIYGGSANSWEELLVSLYILCKPTEEGKKIKQTVYNIFKNCFKTEITKSIYFTRLNLDHIFKRSNDIKIDNDLLSNDYIIDYIRIFKEKINNVKNIDYNNDLKIINDNYFKFIISNSTPEGREATILKVEDARIKLKEIFHNLASAVYDLPKIFINTISKNFESDMTVIASVIKKGPNGKNLFSLDEIFSEYREFLEDKIQRFKESYISDEEKITEEELENKAKELFQEELDNLCEKNILFKKEDGKNYSIIALNNKILDKLAKLYKSLPSLEKKMVINLALKYSGG